MTPQEIRDAPVLVLKQNCDCDDMLPISTSDNREICSKCGTELDQQIDASIYEQIENSKRVVLAAEDWAKTYDEDPESFAQLIKAEAKLERVLLEYFKDLGDRSSQFVLWQLYNQKLSELQAATDDFNVDVMVTDIPDGEDDLIMQIIYEPIALAVEAGILGAEARYARAITDAEMSELVTKITNERIAALVGRRIDKDGNIVPAKNPKYRISDVTRDKIVRSVRTSLSLRETQEQAVKRLSAIIKDKKRAERIAATEAVNGYQGSEYRYALLTKAVKKEWQTLLGACPQCSGYAALGAVPIDYVYNKVTGTKAPSAHPFDRCGMRYIYQEELDNAK